MNLLNLSRDIRNSFRAKIFYSFTAFIAVIYISFIIFFNYYQSKSLKNNLIRDGKQLASLLAYSSRLGVFAENKDMLIDPIEGILQHKEVLLVEIFTSNGNQLKSMGKRISSTFNQDKVKQEEIFDMVRHTKTIVYIEHKDHIEFWAPVIIGGSYSEESLFFEENSVRARNNNSNNIIGLVRIVITTELLSRSLRDLLVKSIFMLILFLIPGWIIAYFIIKGITKPLGKLTESVKLLGKGKKVEKVSIETNDEIGKLASAFNNMIDSLKAAEAEKQKFEEQLRHSQKMEAIGTFAGGIAHDFNNILSTIIGYGHLLRKTSNKKDPAKQYLDNLLSTAERATSLTRSLLAFSRKQTIDPQPVSLNEIVMNVEKIIVQLLDKNISCKVELAKEDITILSDPGQIEQVIMNLVTNARDAMPHGGVLTITTSTMYLDKEFFTPYKNGKSGLYAMLSVADTGIGMDEEIKKRIFDPFFTTKEVGKGTGLGLSIVYGIISQHNGYITVDSRPGEGTTFKIYLPLYTPIEEKKADTPPLLTPATNTILIAEDDDNVRNLLSHILEQHGYTVIKAVNGDDAIQKFIQNRDKISLLMFDILMPKKNGQEAYKEIKKLSPDIKVLFISGYDTITHNRETLEEKINIIYKPVLPDKLIKKIREILNS
jgi:hypothetical protein